MSNRRYKLTIDDQGQPHVEKLDESTSSSDIQPAEDGKYYLENSVHAAYLALTLSRKGVETYCAKCKAPLLVVGPTIKCSKDPKHFSGMLNIQDGTEL